MYTDRINIRRALSLTLLAVWFAPLWAGAQAVADVTEITYLDGVGGFYQEAVVGFAAGSFAGTPSVGVELAYAAGYQWKTAFGGGLSAGVAAYRHQPGYTYYPVMAEARGYIWDNSSAPYYKLGIGYGFSFQESHEEVVAAKGGLCNQLALGLRFISDNQQTPDDLTSDRAGNALAADVGLFYRSKLQVTEGNDSRWRAGVALSNVGTPIAYVSDGPESPLPTTLRFGVGRDIIYDYDSSLSLTLEANTMVVAVSDNSLGVGLGAEYVFRSDLFLRSGYYLDTADNTDRNYLTLGAGVRRGNLLVDVSYLFSTSRVVNPFENTLRVGISFGFGQRFYHY